MLLGLVDVSEPAGWLHIILYVEVGWVLEPIESVCELWDWGQVAALVVCFEILGVWSSHAVVWRGLRLLLHLIVHVCHRVLHLGLHKGIVLGWRGLGVELLTRVVLRNVRSTLHRLVMGVSAPVVRALVTVIGLGIH